MSPPEHDVAVVGGGVVGVATAKHLAEAGVDVAVVEKEHALGAHQSGRNSGVLHPGFNYEPGSLKAEFATEGTRRATAYCREHGVPCEVRGVVVVATTDDEEARLDALRAQADANGVEARVVDRGELREREPHAAGQAALYCPAAASIDSVQYLHQLARDLRAADGTLYLGYEVESLARRSRGWRLHTSTGDLDCRHLVNAAGLQADRLAAACGVGGDARVVPFRGEYHEVVPARRELCRSMIYPTPDPDLPFLGVHFTRRSDGRVLVGPNAVLAFGREAYDLREVDPGDLRDTLSFEGFWRLLADPQLLRVAASELGKSASRARFVAAARRLVPALDAEDVRPSYAGVRAQLVDADGQLVADPRFAAGPDSTHVLNAVSPGLTCSLPFGDHLAGRVTERL